MLILLEVRLTWLSSKLGAVSIHLCYNIHTNARVHRWRDCFMNEDFLDEFPRLKMIMQFGMFHGVNGKSCADDFGAEYEKIEQDGGVDDLRDYRFVNKTEITDAFSQELAGFATRVSW